MRFPISLFLTVFLFGSSVRAAEPAVQKPGKFQTVVRHGVKDVTGTFASWPLLVILGGAGSAILIHQFDTAWEKPFRDGGYLGKADKILEFAGQPYVLDPLAIGVYGFGALAHREKIKIAGEVLTETLLLTDFATGGLKLAFDRDRPNGGKWSFPSGHASSTFAVATALETLYGPKVGLPAYLAAGLVSFSRLDGRDHFASDVLFGAALGSAIGFGTARFHKGENRHLFIAPSLAGYSGINAGGQF